MSLELRRGSALLAACAALAGLGGCLIYNENHCAYVMQNGGADPCPADHVCNRCSPDNNGCVAIADLGSVAPQCVEGGSTGTTTQTSTTQPTEATTMGPSSTSTSATSTTIGDTETTMPATATETVGTDTSTSTSSTSGSSTTGESLCDPAQQLVDPDCDQPGEPYCVGVGTCGPCVELGNVGKSCADVDANKTVCDDASGLCVQCTKDDTSACPAEMPGCSPDGVCAPCTEHRECPTTACDIEEGLCFPEDSVIYVKNDLAVCNGGNGTMAKPFCNFQAALPTLMPGKKTTIKVIPGGIAAMKPLALPVPGYILAVISADKQIPTLDGKSNFDSTIEVSMDSRVYVAKLRFQYSSSPSVLQCTSGTLYLDDVKIEGDGINTAKAIDAVSCKTVIQRSRIFKNVSGIQLTGGSVSLENTHLSQNGTATSAFGAFNLLGGATARINYSSIGLHPQTKSTSVFKCAAGTGQIVIRNSAVLGLTPMQSPDCMASIKQEMGVVQQVATVDEQTAVFDMWFDGLVDGAMVAGAVSPLSDKAMWEADDPRYDYDGTSRPLMSPGYAGADQRPQ